MTHHDTPDASSSTTADRNIAPPTSVETGQRRPDLTAAFTTLAQRIVDGHPDSAAVIGDITIAVQVRPDPDSHPADANPDAYTHEAIAAFGHGDWSFLTITLRIDTAAVRTRASQHRVDHGLATPDGERDLLAGSLLPDLFTEAATNLQAALDAIGRTELPGREHAEIPRSMSSTITDESYPGIAWIPTFDGAVAVGHRDQPQYAHAPYVVGTLRPHPSLPSRHLLVNNPYEARDLGTAMVDAIATAWTEGLGSPRGVRQS